MSLKISEVIRKLQYIEELYGDIECNFLYDGETMMGGVDKINVVQKRGCKEHVVIFIEKE